MKWSNFATIGCTAAAIGLFVVAMPSQAGKPWHSVTADTDFVGECATTVAAVDIAATPGGISCYGTTQFVPGSANVLRVTMSSAGDTHDGARVRVGCLIRPASTGVWSFCNAFGTGAAPGSYITKNKLPQPLANTNCNDGGGGSADCHDNSIEQTWCIPIDAPDTFDIDVRIGPGAETAPFGIAFIEASTFFVDSTKVDGQCGAGDSSATTSF